MAKFERKKNYVDSGVQGGLISRIMCHWVCFFGITAFLFVVLQAMLGDPELPLPKRLSHVGSEFLLVGVIIIAILPAFVLDTIRFSNRFAGPIVRIRRSLRELAEHGVTDHVQFRDNDFWQEIAGDLNKVIERMSKSKDLRSEPVAAASKENA